MSNIVKQMAAVLQAYFMAKAVILLYRNLMNVIFFCLILLLPGQRTLKVLRNWLSILMLTIS